MLADLAARVGAAARSVVSTIGRSRGNPTEGSVLFDDAVVRGMDELLAAPDWPACRPIVSRNPLLLGDQADLLCRRLVGLARAQGDETMVATLYLNWEFLRSCRVHGLATGIASFTDW